jgi:squalene-associated FAD-dependent desaturase
VIGRRVAVIGGGLAGITAAIDLCEAGAGVTLLEARPRLGGATSSFSRGGLTIDTGQHVFLRCCTAYRELLARLGMTGSVRMQDRFDVTVLAPGRQARLRRSGLPAPLHLARALASYDLLSPAERIQVARAAVSIRLLRPGSPGLDGQRLGDWLARRGQSERARRRLWDLFIVSALNIAGDDADVALAATVIRTGLLGSADAADIGVPAAPLGTMHGEAAAALLGRLGATIATGAKATAIQPLPGGVMRVRGPDGAVLADADGVVLAVPAAQAARLAPATALPDRWKGLSVSPIVNVHVIYSRRVTRLPLAAAVDSPVQWIFDKTRVAGLNRGQYLAVSLSAADQYVDMPVSRLREQFLPALERLFPLAADTEVTDFFVTRERAATLRQAAGCGALRPAAVTPLPGLVLAGAWTDTGWPDTMEGAVRSGHTAAQALITAEPAHPARSAEPAAPGGGMQQQPAGVAPQAGAAS